MLLKRRAAPMRMCCAIAARPGHTSAAAGWWTWCSAKSRTTPMTEAEWFASEDPKRMLAFVLDGASERKLRLFAVACCRPILQFLAESQSCRHAIEVGE